MRDSGSARAIRTAKSIMASNTTQSSAQQWGYLDLAVPQHVLVKQVGKAIVWNQVWNQAEHTQEEFQVGEIPYYGHIASNQNDVQIPPVLSSTHLTTQSIVSSGALGTTRETPRMSLEMLNTGISQVPAEAPIKGPIEAPMLTIPPAAASGLRIPRYAAPPRTASGPRFTAPVRIRNLASLVKPLARYPRPPGQILRLPATPVPMAEHSSAKQSRPPLEEVITLPATAILQLPEPVASYMPRPSVVTGPIHPSAAFATKIPDLMSLNVSVSDHEEPWPKSERHPC